MRFLPRHTPQPLFSPLAGRRRPRRHLCFPPPFPPAPFPPRRGRKGEQTATFDFVAPATTPLGAGLWLKAVKLVDTAPSREPALKPQGPSPESRRGDGAVPRRRRRTHRCQASRRLAEATKPNSAVGSLSRPPGERVGGESGGEVPLSALIRYPALPLNPQTSATAHWPHCGVRAWQT